MPGTLTDISGLWVGHWTDTAAATGCTVIRCPPETVGGVDVRGSAPGTRETDLLRPLNLVQHVHALLLTGGSAFGLDAAGGVMRWLAEQGIGFPAGPAVVPIVPAAVLFDLHLGRADVHPTAEAGYAACQAASPTAAPTGTVGAGTGATVGKLLGPDWATKGGLGSAARRIGGGITVGALVAVNAFGDVVDPQNGRIVAGCRNPQGRGFLDTTARLHEELAQTTPGPAENTTLAVVATDAALNKEETNKLAQMAHDGLARTIRPVHTMWDGDTVFALATGQVTDPPANVSVLGAIAAEALAEAVLEAVRAASGLAGVPACGDLG